jgi:hypothetical protein
MEGTGFELLVRGLAVTLVAAPFDAPGCLGRVGSRPSDPATAIAAPRTDTNLGFRIFDAKRYVGVFLADIASRRTTYAPWNQPAILPGEGARSVPWLTSR